ncbi:MAG: hypothetical protein DRJ67_03005 [Thermoprotei archaeon]|nr:MAG: hypothetical protein DRJ67_03005 [Thermoprotei archaeon]
MDLVDAVASVVVFSIALSLLMYAAPRVDVDYYTSLKMLKLRSRADAIVAALEAGVADYGELREMFPDVGFALRVEYPANLMIIRKGSSLLVDSSSGSVPVEVHVFSAEILNYTGFTPIEVPYQGGIVVAVSPYGYAVYGVKEAGQRGSYDYVIYFNGRGTGVCKCKPAYGGPKVYLSGGSYWIEPKPFELKPDHPYRPQLTVQKLANIGNWTAVVTVEVWPRP